MLRFESLSFFWNASIKHKCHFSFAIFLWPDYCQVPLGQLFFPNQKPSQKPLCCHVRPWLLCKNNTSPSSCLLCLKQPLISLIPYGVRCVWASVLLFVGSPSQIRSVCHSLSFFGPDLDMSWNVFPASHFYPKNFVPLSLCLHNGHSFTACFSCRVLMTHSVLLFWESS